MQMKRHNPACRLSLLTLPGDKEGRVRRGTEEEEERIEEIEEGRRRGSQGEGRVVP